MCPRIGFISKRCTSFKTNDYSVYLRMYACSYKAYDMYYRKNHTSLIV